MNRYINILKSQNLQIEWDAQHKECISKYTDSSTRAPIYLAYPCLKFLQSRLELFNEFQVGAFIWEGGQGLEYFYELL